MLQQEIYDVLQHLDDWMADEYASTNLFNAPASSCIQKDPLGVVLCIGAWNYVSQQHQFLNKFMN